MCDFMYSNLFYLQHSPLIYPFEAIRAIFVHFINPAALYKVVVNPQSTALPCKDVI